MTSFARPDISYKPLEVDGTTVADGVELKSIDSSAESATSIANKLMDHLAIIQAYQDRIEAIDFLIENGRSLAGNPVYTTNDPSLQMSIAAIGGKDNSVDLALFEKAVDIVIQGYQDTALMSFTGVMRK